MTIGNAISEYNWIASLASPCRKPIFPQICFALGTVPSLSRSLAWRLCLYGKVIRGAIIICRIWAKCGKVKVPGMKIQDRTWPGWLCDRGSFIAFSLSFVCKAGVYKIFLLMFLSLALIVHRPHYIIRSLQ